MSVMIEVYYKQPVDCAREKMIVDCASRYGGELTFHEDDTANSVCLTIQFPSWESALAATSKLEESGEHVEGPMDYGDG